METEKYLNFTTEEFILDKEFSVWVLSPDKERDLYWKSFLIEYPEKRDQIRVAALIIKSLQPIEPKVPEQQLNKILQNIKAQNKTKILSGYRWVKYAAGIALLITAGSLIWLSIQRKNQFPFEVDNSTTQKGKVILSNGSTREFDIEQTIIKQTSSGNLIINNDTIEVSNDRKTIAESAMNQIIIPYGQRSEITLADGTHILLNSGSQLYFPTEFKPDSREVYLTGEAFFDVTTDASNTFYVITRDFKIKVLGTSFNVCSYNDDRTIQTVLLKGKVSAGKNKLLAKTIDLFPGERIVYDKENDILAKDKVNVQLYTSWINGYLIFENEPITEVFKKLERHYNQSIKVREALEKITFSGKLDLKDNINDVLENISFASSVKVSEENGLLIIKQ